MAPPWCCGAPEGGSRPPSESLTGGGRLPHNLPGSMDLAASAAMGGPAERGPRTARAGGEGPGMRFRAVRQRQRRSFWRPPAALARPWRRLTSAPASRPSWPPSSRGRPPARPATIANTTPPFSASAPNWTGRRRKRSAPAAPAASSSSSPSLRRNAPPLMATIARMKANLQHLTATRDQLQHRSVPALPAAEPGAERAGRQPLRRQLHGRRRAAAAGAAATSSTCCSAMPACAA